MNKGQWTLRLAASLVLVAGLLSPAAAEVAVETDDNGGFVELHVGSVETEQGTCYWTADPDRPQDQALNPAGDAIGDGSPVSVVLPPASPEQGPRPLVVWSHPVAGERHLYYSTWSQQDGWRTPRQVAATEGVSQDPVLLVDPNGQARLSWWTESNPSTVWTAGFETSNWLELTAESDPAHDGRNSRLYLNQSNELVLEWEELGSDGQIHHRTLIKDRFDPEC